MNRVPPVVVLLVSVVSLAGCAGEEESSEPIESTKPVEVRLSSVTLREVATPLQLTGTVRAKRSTAISSRILSTINSIHVDEGDVVRKGQRLVDLDDRDLVSALRSAEAARDEAESAIRLAEHDLESVKAQRELAEITFQRFQELLEKNSTTRHEYDRASAAVRSARAAVEAAQSRQAGALSTRSRAEAGVAAARVSLSHAGIHSPLSGVVTRRLEDPGSLAVPGKPILQIERSDAYWLEIVVPESHAGSLQVGQTLDAVIDALDAGAMPQTRVAQIVPEVDAASRTFIAKLDLPGRPGLRSGLYGRAFLPGEPREIIWVPAAAVVERGEIRSVFVVDAGRARMRLVTLGSLLEGGYEVLSGLAAGEKVVVSPSGLSDGGPVRTTGSEGGDGENSR